MRVDVRAVPTPDGWTVRVTRDGAELLAPRHLRRVEDGLLALPVPPPEEVAALPAGAPHADVLTGGAAALRDLLGKLGGQVVSPDHATACGRWLLQTLLGDGFSVIEAAADGSPVELVLEWPGGERVLTGLPWELACDTTGFLAARRVGFVRVIGDAVADPKPLPAHLPLRVLFVIGADLADPQIRAGAEYLALVRGLVDRGRPIVVQLVLDATVHSLQRAIEDFDPHVVHVVAHGGADPGGYLELRDPEDPSRARKTRADVLGPLLGDRVVVLNACTTGGGGLTALASEPSSQPALPLAAELVAGSTPVALGMAGRVSDRACRLFARAFYETLVQGGSLSAATAHGRWAALAGAGSATAGIDWGRPALFRRADVADEVVADQGGTAAWDAVRTLGNHYRIHTDPPFCDRLTVLHHYRELMSTGAPVLVLEVQETGLKKEDQLGKSRVLRELAIRALADGRAPCLVDRHVGEEVAGAAPEATGALKVALTIGTALHDLRSRLPAGPPAEMHLARLRDVVHFGADPSALDPVVRAARGLGTWEDARVAAAALALDLAALAEDCGRPPLVLVDDAALVFGSHVELFLRRFLGPHGLGRPGQPVPVVVTCGTVGGTTEEGPGARTVRQWLEGSAPAWVTRHALEPFSPEEAELAYRHFLLHGGPPLIEAPDHPGELISVLADKVAGIPSRLRSVEVEIALEMALRFGGAELADDDALLAGLAGGGR